VLGFGCCFFFVDSALCSLQSFETLWKRVIIREAGH